MTDKQSIIEESKSVGRFLYHSIALVLGIVCLIVALAMGVSLVLLPGGLVVGLLGYLLIVCGLYAKPQRPARGDSSD